MRLFGGLLPFIGFREEEVDEDLRSFFGLPPEQKTINTFQVEWFNYGVSIATNPRPKQEE